MNRKTAGSIFYKCIVLLALMALACPMLSACGDDGDEETGTAAAIDGVVSSPEDFAQLGVFIDMEDSENITDKEYRISGNIAIVSFKYIGVKVELRGSSSYDEYELAGVENTSIGNMVASNVMGYDAVFYTLDPGRVAFWSDENINYSLYIYVTSTDDILREILSLVRFEDKYSQREDVQEQTESDSRAFAERVIGAFEDKDLEAMTDMIDYPQETGNGQSIANSDELLALDADELCTDILLKALEDEKALDELRLSEDGKDYIIGTNYKNIHFRLMDDGTFKIVKINN